MAEIFTQLFSLDYSGASAPNLQRQVYIAIQRAVLDRTLPPGTRLPSTRALATDLGVSRTTTLIAYDQLLAEGYLEARHGSGTFVAVDLPDDYPRITESSDRCTSMHPPLSHRGTRLSGVASPARRLAGPPRPFRVGVPAVDLFPMALWSQLEARATRSSHAEALDYADPAGVPKLREAIARHVTIARGTSCAPEQIIIVAGAQRGIDLMCRLLLDPGEAAWLEEPGYAGAQSALIAADARIVPVPVDSEGLDVAAGTAQAPRARLAYVTPSHQFPLGVPMSLPRRLALLNWARKTDAWIIEDDYDSEFRYGTRPIPALHGLDADGRVIYVGSFSKSLFPSLRLGFLIVPPDMTPTLLDIRRASDVHPPVVAQMALAAFMDGDHYQRHLRRMRSVYRERLETLQDAVVHYCGGAVRLRPVNTGLHAVADLCDEVMADSLADECAERGIEVTPMSTYFMNSPCTGNAVVLGFAAVSPDAIRSGVEILAEALDAVRHPRQRSADAASPLPSR